MVKNYDLFKSNLKALSFATLLSGGSLFSQQAPVTMTFVYTGAPQQLAMPCGANSMTIQAWGAVGGTGGSGGSAGANGGYTRGVITATPGQVLEIYVGGQGSVTAGGFNGGGNGGVSSTSSGAGGGGATDIRVGGNLLTHRFLVAGGGGGGGGNSTYLPAAGVGGGGSSFSSGIGFGGGGTAGSCATGSAGGEAGGSASSYGSGGGGGGFTSGGGGGGQPNSSSGGYGCPGLLGLGGHGGGTSFICGGVTGGVNGGGGGGGGFYGGGGGMSGTGGCNGGGGGGSSWVSGIVSSSSFSPGISAGHGSVIITVNFNSTAVGVSPAIPAVCLGNGIILTGTGSNSYTWAPVGSLSWLSATTVSVNPSSNTVYTVSGTNPLGCVSTHTVLVHVTSAAPILTISASSTSICLGRTVTLNSSGAVNYSWSGGISNGITFTPQATTAYTLTGSNGCGTTTAVQVITVNPIPVSVIATPTLVCEGYPSVLTAVSGAPLFSWLPFGTTGSSVIATPTANSIYTVAVTDGTCVGMATVAVTTKQTPTIVPSTTFVTLCLGDPVTLSATGAGAGGSYSWSPGNGTSASINVSPTTSTLYTVYGTNSLNCTAIAQIPISVQQPFPLNVTASKTLVCSGGQIVLTASGSQGYSWTNGPATGGYTVNPTAAITIYTVTGSNTTNLCLATRTIALAAITPNVVYTSSASVCAGKSATMTAAGANTYTWNGFNTGSSGIYVYTPAQTSTIVLVANTVSLSTTCTSTLNAVVLVNSNPSVTIASSKTTTICRGVTVVLTASGANSYTWSSGATTNTISVKPNSTTTYTLAALDVNNCEGTQQYVVTVSPCSSIAEQDLSNSVHVFPNPNNGDFTIHSNSALSLYLFNSLGQSVRYIELDGLGNFEVNVKDLSNGVYFLQGTSNNQSINTRIVVAK